MFVFLNSHRRDLAWQGRIIVVRNNGRVCRQRQVRWKTILGPLLLSPFSWWKPILLFPGEAAYIPIMTAAWNVIQHRCSYTVYQRGHSSLTKQHNKECDNSRSLWDTGWRNGGTALVIEFHNSRCCLTDEQNVQNDRVPDFDNLQCSNERVIKLDH